MIKNQNKLSTLDQLKIDLISRYYPLSKVEVAKHKNVLNIDRYHLMENPHIQWDDSLIDIMRGSIDWTAVWKLKNIRIDLSFFEKFEQSIDFTSIQLSKNIEWSKEILEKYGSRFDWYKTLILNDSIATVDNLRRYKDDLDWSLVSRRINISFDDEVIKEFENYWDWKNLSANINLPLTVDFIQQYDAYLDFDNLSMNPQSLPLVYKYPTSIKWNWKYIILNPAIAYNESTFDFLFWHFQKSIYPNLSTYNTARERALYSFVLRVLTHQKNDIKYFLNDSFEKYIPWDNLCSKCSTTFPIAFIEKHINQFDFKSSAFLRHHKDIITLDFIKDNIDLFDLKSFSFYSLPLSLAFVHQNRDSIYWVALSNADRLDWSWEFIETNIDKLDLFKLGVNKSVFDRLILNAMSKDDVLALLESIDKKAKESDLS